MPPDATIPWRPTFLLLTCEHGGRDVPPDCRRFFRGATAALRSHRGQDIGALGVAQELAARLAAPLILSTVTRLLVELNRSVGHPELFSVYTRALPPETRADLVARFHSPYRAAVTTTLDALTGTGHRVLHVSVHSFTDVLDGVPRDFDLGLLFDPARPSEVDACEAWRAALAGADQRIRDNEPYLGVDDGLTTALRTRYAPASYAGVELEIRQGLIARRPAQRAVAEPLAAALARLVAP